MRQAAGQQRRAVAQRQHDEGQRRRKIERGRGQEGDAQHAHGAPPQFVGRRGERPRLGLRLAVQHDGGDAAHAVEEARLQPRQRQELAARGGRRADAGSAIATGTSSPHSDQHERRPADRPAARPAPPAAGRRSASVAAGSQRANRPSSASMRSTTVAVSSPVCWVRSRAGPACSRRDSASVRSRRRAAAPALKAARSAATDSAARSSASTAKPANRGTGSPAWPVSAPASSIAAHQAWPTAIAVPSDAEQRRRPGRPAAGAPLAAQPGARCCLDLIRLHRAARLAQTARAGQGEGLNCGQGAECPLASALRQRGRHRLVPHRPSCHCR